MNAQELADMAQQTADMVKKTVEDSQFLNAHRDELIASPKFDPAEAARAGLIIKLGPELMLVMHRGDAKAMLEETQKAAKTLSDLADDVRSRVSDTPDDGRMHYTSFMVEGPDTLQ